MPFTLSHPALIIPLLHVRRRHPWLSATGLITGSVAPDFEKFLTLQLASSYSHTFASIFYFSCPVSLVVAFIFHGLVRRPLLAHLPQGLHRRLGRPAHFDWPRYFRQHPWGVLLSIVLGAALHLFWDLFTHPNALMMHLAPDMDRPIWLGGREVTLFQVSALVNSVVGGLAIAWAIWKMPARPAGPVPPAPALWSYWGMAALVAAALVVQWVLVVQPRLVEVGITTISAAMLGIIAASIYTQRQRPAPGRPR